MGNAVIHFELMSKEPEKVSAFYAKIFDWKVTHHPEINYRVVETGAEGEMHGINGGIVKPDKPGPWPGNMLFYILVDDLAAYRKKCSPPAARSRSRSTRWRAWASSRSSPTPRAA